MPQIYILWALLFLPVNLLTSLYLAILLGLQNILAYNLVNIIRALLNLFLLIASALLSLGLPGAIWSWLLANLGACLMVFWFLRKELRPIVSVPAPILAASFRYGIKSYPANLFTLFTYRLDTFFVNLYSGAASVGLYSTSVSSAELLWYVPNAISSTLFPKSATLDKDVGAQLTASNLPADLAADDPPHPGLRLPGSYLHPALLRREFYRCCAPLLVTAPRNCRHGPLEDHICQSERQRQAAVCHLFIRPDIHSDHPVGYSPYPKLQYRRGCRRLNHRLSARLLHVCLLVQPSNAYPLGPHCHSPACKTLPMSGSSSRRSSIASGRGTRRVPSL